MEKIHIKDKTFRPYISGEEIARAVDRVARCIREDVRQEEGTPLFVVMLNGAFMFASDLLRAIDVPCEVAFMRMKSYQGTASTGTVDLLQDMHAEISGRTVIVIEDIVDTGATMHALLEHLQRCRPKCVKIASLLFKPESLQYDVPVDYVAFEIPRDFIVGYGLDYDEEGRNLKDIYVIDN
ncbi:MAG TPA: hypoxanthine phosphoribosyltransferase [Candidatus Caccoplasma merdavium]|nr:hypoxanthine phosphoribosyltransferase [Candidatus Caccoplasma merdavium]